MAARVSGRGRSVSAAERVWVLECLRRGDHQAEVAVRLGCSRRTVERVYAAALIKSRRIGLSELRLSFGERELISRGLAAGQSARAIARQLGRSPSTVTRELVANGGRGGYRALAAQQRAIRCSGRPRRGKLARCPRLLAAVEAGLLRRWSPQQISARLRADYPDDPELWISHETIYQSLYVQSRGELRRQLAANLRTKRTRRGPRGAGLGQRGKIRDMVPISQRPPQVEDRAVPGHWEGDLLVGKQGRSFIATLVERQTRYLMLARLGDKRTTEHVTDALKKRIQELPTRARSLADLGPAQRTLRPRPLLGADRCRGLFLRPALTLATRLKRKHQRATTPIPAQRQRSGSSQPDRARPDRSRTQRPPPPNPRLGNTS